MSMKLTRAAAVAISAAALMTFTACEDAADGVAGAPGAAGESCTAKKLKDGSGYELKCGGETVGTIYNGENGEPGEAGEPGASAFELSGAEDLQEWLESLKGENGTNCTVADTTDEEINRTGYKLLCADTLMGLVWNGLDGEPGESCTAKSVEDEDTGRTGYQLTCGGVVKGTVWDGLDGEAGESCTVKNVTDEDTGRTGYKLTCGGVVKGTVWNGLDGVSPTASEIFDLDYYNRLLLGQKGSGFKWRYQDVDANSVSVGEGTANAFWYYWTDKNLDENPGSSGFDWDNIPGIVDSEKDGVIDDDDAIKDLGGVGGTVILMHNEATGWNQVDLDVICHGETNCFETDKMLGLCLEYISEFNTEVRIKYVGEANNGYARPFVNIPQSSTKKVVNLPWAAFNKSPDWGTVTVNVSDAIKAMNGVSVAVSNGNEKKTGIFLISKIGAYGNCE